MLSHGHLLHGDGEIRQLSGAMLAPSAISFLPIRYSGAALTASTAATAPSRRWKTANLRAAGSPRSTSVVGRPRQARDLQLQIILVRPEPGHFAIGLGPAQPSPARHAWPGRWRSARIPAGSRSPSRPIMARAVAGREDRGIAGHGIAVHHDAVLAGQPGSGGQLVIGQHADAHQHDVGRHTLAAGAHRSTLPLPSKRFDAGVADSASRPPSDVRRHRNPTPAGTRRAPSAGPAASNTVTSSPRLAPTAATSSPI